MMQGANFCNCGSKDSLILHISCSCSIFLSALFVLGGCEVSAMLSSLGQYNILFLLNIFFKLCEIL